MCPKHCTINAISFLCSNFSIINSFSLFFSLHLSIYPFRCVCTNPFGYYLIQALVCRPFGGWVRVWCANNCHYIFIFYCVVIPFCLGMKIKTIDYTENGPKEMQNGKKAHESGTDKRLCTLDTLEAVYEKLKRAARQHSFAQSVCLWKTWFEFFLVEIAWNCCCQSILHVWIYGETTISTTSNNQFMSAFRIYHTKETNDWKRSQSM